MISKEYLIDNKKTMVKLGYDIFPEILKEIERDFSESFFVISKNFFPYIAEHINRTPFKYILIDDGEESKSFDKLEELCEKILSNDVDKKSVIISVGGGTISDLVGLAASLILRGLRLIHIPTTLIAQADSAICGKTAINSKYGKNLIGSFHLPERTYCDIKFLEYLHQRNYNAGYAEILKYGLILDQSFYEYLLSHQEDFIMRKADYLLYIVEKSVDCKMQIVASDFRDQSIRRILNFGHTIGHAIEQASNYRILHGESVAVGMYLEAEFSSLSEKAISEQDLQNLKDHLHNLGLNTSLDKQITPEILMKFILKDKKNIDKQITIIMLKSIGNAWVNNQVDYSTFKNFIEQRC
jgi:3-dehydroquinate synthase